MTCIAIHDIFVLRYRKEVFDIADKSRADYFRKRRAERKGFSVLLPKEKVLKIEEWLKDHNKTKTQWLEEKIDEELKKIEVDEP